MGLDPKTIMSIENAVNRERERTVKDFLNKMKLKDEEIKKLEERIDNAVTYLEKCKDGIATFNVDYTLKLLGVARGQENKKSN